MVIHNILFLLSLFHLTKGDYIQCFNSLRNEFQWPLGPDTENQCRSSTVFGPIKGQCINPGAYSFASSMNLLGHVGDPVFALTKGKVVEMGDVFPNKNGDLIQTIVIEHDLPTDVDCKFAGQEVKSFFTLYGHIAKDNTTEATDIFVGKEVSAGDKIGTMGKCTMCKKDLGTKTSIRYQVRLNVEFCPKSGKKCGRFGSPIHPLITRPPIKNVTLMEVTQYIEPGFQRGVGMGGIFVIKTGCSETDLFRINMTCSLDYQYDDDDDSEIPRYRPERKELSFSWDLNTQDIPRPGLAGFMPKKYPFYPRSEKKWTTKFLVGGTFFGLNAVAHDCDVTFEGLLGQKVTKELKGYNDHY